MIRFVSFVIFFIPAFVLGNAAEELEKKYANLLDPLVEDGLLPSYFLSVSDRNGLIFDRGLGTSGAIIEKDPTSQTRFALLSLSKPIVALAVLKLLELENVSLDTSVSKYLPEFKDARVCGESALVTDIKIVDLFRHTSGLGNNLEFSGARSNQMRSAGCTRELAQLYQDKALMTFNTVLGANIKNTSLEDQVNKLSSLPLLFKAGHDFQYSLSTDVLGRIAEVLSKESLDVFLKDVLFEPLGMKNTGFYVDEEDRYRRATLMKPLIRTFPVPGTYQRFEKYPFRQFEVAGIGDRVNVVSAGMGLVSTGEDMAKFANFILRELSLYDGSVFLSASMSDLIFKNQLPSILGENPLKGKLPRASGDGMSLIFNIRAKDRSYREVFERKDVDFFYWSGFSSSVFWVDPLTGVSGVFLSQIRPTQNYLIGDLDRIADSLITAK